MISDVLNYISLPFSLSIVLWEPGHALIACDIWWGTLSSKILCFMQDFEAIKFPKTDLVWIWLHLLLPIDIIMLISIIVIIEEIQKHNLFFIRFDHTFLLYFNLSGYSPPAISSLASFSCQETLNVFLYRGFKICFLRALSMSHACFLYRFFLS